MLIGQVNKLQEICSSKQVSKQDSCANSPHRPRTTAGSEGIGRHALALRATSFKSRSIYMTTWLTATHRAYMVNLRGSNYAPIKTSPASGTVVSCTMRKSVVALLVLKVLGAVMLVRQAGNSAQRPCMCNFLRTSCGTLRGSTARAPARTHNWWYWCGKPRVGKGRPLF